MPKVTSYPYQNSTMKRNFSEPFLKYKRLKLKLRVFLASHSVVMVTFCVMKIIPMCSPVIGQFWARARNWQHCYVTTGRGNHSKNRHVMCCELGGVRFFVVFPREFVTEIKLMWYCEILLWNLEAFPTSLWMIFMFTCS